MNWNFIINGAPLGSGDPSGGYSPRKKEWIQLALAGASLASSIWGGVKAAKQQREAERRLSEEKAANDAWYNRRYNESYADTAAGQNMIRMAKDYARENWKKAAGARAVGGGSDAEVAEAKAEGNRMVGNAIAQIAATDTARKDNADAAYRAEKARLTQQQIAIDQQKAQNIADTASGMSNALASGAEYFGTGSPGGGGVDPAPKQNQLEKMGIDSNDKWLKKNEDKIFDYNNNYNLLQSVMGDYA